MAHYKYLIIGGGMTADAATRGIRDVDPGGAIGMLTEEPDPPYNRPPLSKDLWKGKPVERIWLKTRERGVDILLNCSVRSIDPAQRTVTDAEGRTYTFDRLLIATDGRPRILDTAPSRRPRDLFRHIPGL